MSGGGGGGGTNTTTTTTQQPAWVQQQAQTQLGQAQAILAGAPSYQTYPGPTLAGFTPDQQAAFQAVRNMQGVAPGQIGQAQAIAGNLPQSTASLLAPYMNQVGGAATGAMTQAASDIAAGASTPGISAFGGGRTAAETAAIGSETDRNISHAMASIASQGWNASTAEALQQAQTMGSIAQAGQRASLLDASALAQVGQAQQTQQQAQYATALQQWQQQQNWPYQQLAIAQSALAGTPYGTTVTAAQPYNTNPAASTIGAVASAAPIFGNLGQIGQGATDWWNQLTGSPLPTSNYGASPAGLQQLYGDAPNVYEP